MSITLLSLTLNSHYLTILQSAQYSVQLRCLRLFLASYNGMLLDHHAMSWKGPHTQLETNLGEEVCIL